MIQIKETRDSATGATFMGVKEHEGKRDQGSYYGNEGNAGGAGRERPGKRTAKEEEGIAADGEP